MLRLLIARRPSRPGLRQPTLTAATMAVLSLSGCNEISSVDAPDVVQPIDYETAAGATALAAGAITGFHSAFGGAFQQVVASGLIADELSTTALTTTDWEWDARDFKPFTTESPFGALSDTRQRLLTAIGSFRRVAPDSSARIGQLFALLGYTSVFFGENYCSGVPLSRRDAALRPVYGQPLTSTELFDSALVAFDSALTYGANSTRVVNLARVGRGRALLDQGRFDEAAQAVANVPTEYVYQVAFLDTTGTYAPRNGLAFVNTAGNHESRITIPEQEGGNGLNWRTANDPRVPVVRHSPMLAGGSELWLFVPYEAADASIALGSGIEARLIEAEAAVRLGDAVTWLAIHNALRGMVAGLDPLSDPGTVSERVDLHFRERAFWLFLTGHRHGDLRRMVRQYGRDAETVFPSGIWREGVLYGPATNMAPPPGELNNPHYTGCLNRDA